MKTKLTENKIKAIYKKVMTALGAFFITAPCMMILMALFIDFTEAEKNMALVSMIVGIFVLILADPGEAKTFIIDDMVLNNDFECDNDEEYIEELDAYYDTYAGLFYYYDDYDKEYYYFDDNDQQYLIEQYNEMCNNLEY